MPCRLTSTIFQSTLSMRRATSGTGDGRNGSGISIHALHEESDRSQQWLGPLACISIHALHEESDHTRALSSPYSATISIHALHEESDRRMRCTSVLVRVFQSTLSMRRATRSDFRGPVFVPFQSTLSMRRVTRRWPISAYIGSFQSTLSMRRATYKR